jgi:hypothetical protein
MLKRILPPSFICWSIASFFFVIALFGLTQPTRIASIIVMTWGLIFLPPLYHRLTARYGWKRNVIGRLAAFFIAPILIVPALSEVPQAQTPSRVSVIADEALTASTPIAIESPKSSPSPIPSPISTPAFSEPETVADSESIKYKRKPPIGKIAGMHRLERHTESRDYLEFGEFAVNFPETPIARSKHGMIYPGQSEEVDFLIINKYGDKVHISAACHWNGDNDYMVSSISYQTIDGSELPTTEATIIKHAHQICAN